MTKTSISCLAMASAFAAVVALPASAQAQSGYGYQPNAPMSTEEVQALPSEYRSAPRVTDYTETTVDADGVETITRTRRIERSAPYPAPHAAHGEYTEYEVDQYAYRSMPAHAPTYAPAAQVFQREQWIEECERRTHGRGDREKGGIIGGLLGAIAGGIIGNRVSDGERLAGTLIGAGTGGIAGVLLGSLIGGGRNSDGDYDCEAALDSYLSQHGYSGVYAARSIPAPAYAAPAYYPPAPAYQGYSYGYAAPAYQGYSYSYAPPQQVVYVPVRYEQQQRVIVRETVREEVIPGATRSIPTPVPTPQPVAPTPQPAPQPVPAPAEPRYIKGY